MRTIGILSLLVGLLPCFLAARLHAQEEEEKDQEQAVAAALARLDALTEVAGDRVGYAGTEGAFFALSRTLVAHGDEELLRDLLADASPVARAMGLYALAQLDGAAAVPALREALPDRTRFLHFPGGCVGYVITVGTFAYHLLEDRTHLTYGSEAQPLLAPGARLALDLEILADDRMVDTHADARTSLRKAVAEERLRLDLDSLHGAAPDLDPLRLVKAVGRLGAPAFLRAVLDDETLPREVRMAAASALSRDPDAVEVLQTHRAFLDTLALGEPGRGFVETARARRLHDEHWAPIHAVRTWKGQEEIEAEIREAVVTDEPFAIPHLDRLLGTHLASKPGMREAIGASLLQIARRCGQWSGAWSTWGDTPYRLERMVVPAWAGETDRMSMVREMPHALPPETQAEIQEAIRPFLED